MDQTAKQSVPYLNKWGEKLGIIFYKGDEKKKVMSMEDKEILKEYMLKEIEIIQNIINRMSSNSLL